MVDFVQLQHMMREQLEQDRTIRTINTEGPTLEFAVSEAATLLNIPVRRIEYEVLEKGSPGVLGSGKKNWKIRAYERIQVMQDKLQAALGGGEDELAAHVIEDKNGDVFVRLSQDGAFLKVVPPVGKGKKANEAQAMQLLNARLVKDIDQAVVAETVKVAAGAYVRVGDFEHNPVNDTTVAVDISGDEMKAYLFVSPPGPGGCDLSVETYLSFLRNNRVVYGVKEDFLRDFADRPAYKENVLVAEGSRPVNGRDAYLQYNFETDQTKVRLREGVNGKIDFKDLNIIKNVVEGQPLARKIPAETGIVGRTVNGKVIPAKNGKDISLPLGKNVHVGDDGATIIADMNGQVVEIGGKINVEPIYTVQGDVNLKTGNIIFLGTVIITGNVEDGFSVKAAGNIEVNGTVEKAELDAEGDIIVHQGITGKGSGLVRAGRSIWARFIENAVVEAGNMVVVSDGIINSHVDAFKRIICQGKRAHVVGGRLRASEEINAKILGSPTSGTETICEVGFDPKSKEQLEKLTENKEVLEKRLEEITLNIQTLINIKKQRKSLPEYKEAYLKELMDKRALHIGDLKKVNEEMEKVQAFLNSLRTKGRVSASSKVYPGVKVIIRDFKEDVRNEYRAVTFILENALVRVTKYEEPDEDVKRGPDGYTTN
ncbi:MAG: FapA family protein [Treponema sp.]|nr:FapA family protein [Treponema sp.]